MMPNVQVVIFIYGAHVMSANGPFPPPSLSPQLSLKVQSSNWFPERSGTRVCWHILICSTFSSYQKLPRCRWYSLLLFEAVALYYYSFYFGALVGALIIIGLFFTSFYPLALLYLAWAYLIDSGTPDHGGRRSAYVRKLRVWKYFRDYFPISLVKTTELDAEKNYIFGYHPHGLLCAGAFCNFATEATNFSEVFPGITPHLLPLMGESYSVFILFTF